MPRPMASTTRIGYMKKPPSWIKLMMVWTRRGSTAAWLAAGSRDTALDMEILLTGVIVLSAPPKSAQGWNCRLFYQNLYGVASASVPVRVKNAPQVTQETGRLPVVPD